MGSRFEELASKYKKGWVTEKTLRGWVTLNQKRPGAGITEDEFQQITGKAYTS